ncbi:hypothetical protein B0J14DRAFT_351384 [Halenospora varia]|nr:hypothetical protein B0J14DRAFT_351384 [Halenospora varia]
MSCIQFPHVLSRIGNKCLARIGIKSKQDPKPLVISSPFNFQNGPAVNFPGYSESDISLLKEKAIASTAITNDDVVVLGSNNSEFEFPSGRTQRPHSRAGSTGCGLGSRVVYHARRVSRSCVVGWESNS